MKNFWKKNLENIGQYMRNSIAQLEVQLKLESKLNVTWFATCIGYSNLHLIMY